MASRAAVQGLNLNFIRGSDDGTAIASWAPLSVVNYAIANGKVVKKGKKRKNRSLKLVMDTLLHGALYITIPDQVKKF